MITDCVARSVIFDLPGDGRLVCERESCLATAFGDGDRSFVVLAFYGDDSGSAPRDECFVVAGYLATGNAWFYSLEVPWCEVLQAHPRIAYFKASQCEHLDGEFSNFTRADAERKLESLVGVVSKASDLVSDGIMEVSSVIRWCDYKSSVTGMFRDAYPNPYFFCVHGIVSLIAREYLDAVENPSVRVAYTFDHQSNLDAEMNKQYCEVKNTVDYRVASTMGRLGFDDDKVCPPLQIADLIAWHVRRDFVKPSKDRGERRPAFTALRNSLRYGKQAVWNPMKLAEFSRAVNAGSTTSALWDSDATILRGNIAGPLL